MSLLGVKRKVLPHSLFSCALNSQIGETESSVRDVMVQEVMAVEPVAFKAVAVDIDSIKVESMHRVITPFIY